MHRLRYALGAAVAVLVVMFSVLLAAAAPAAPSATGVVTQAAAAAQPATPTGMTDWWPGDGSAADVVGGHDAVLQGDATFGAGLVGQAFSLDGDGDWVDVPGPASFNFGTSDFTIDLFVRWNTTAGEQVIAEKWVQKYAAPSSGWTFTKLESNNLRFAVVSADGTDVNIDTDSLAIPEGVWQHYAVRRSGDTFTIFVNGIAAASQSVAADLDSAATLKFGHRGSPADTTGSEDTNGFFLNGRADEIQVFNRALTDSEVFGLCAAGGTGTCRTTLHVATDTTLTQDLRGQISVEADNVTLDCAGHSIVGTGWDDATQIGDYVGINLSGHSGVTVKNCHVTGFWYGVLADGNGNNTFINNTANGNAGFGFQLPSGDNNVVTSNVANDNGRDGFAVGNYTTLSGNTANGNSGSGFAMLDGTGSTFTGNAAARNGNAGFYFERAHATRLTNNTAADNIWDGFFLYDSSHNTLAGNTATGNLSHGFFLNGSRANTLTGNAATGSTTYGENSVGFLVSNSGPDDANNNVLRNNTASANGSGIYTSGADNPITGTLLQGNVANNNDWYGFAINRATESNWTGNTANGNGHPGFQTWDSTNNTFTRNTARNNEDGFSLTTSSSNAFVANTAAGNRWDGFLMDPGDDNNTLTANVARDNEGNGFDLTGSGTSLKDNSAFGNMNGFLLSGQSEAAQATLFNGNTANRNTWAGFMTWFATDNTWTNNTSNANGHWGFVFWDPSGSNTISANVARFNGEYDAYDLNDPLNNWTNNHFGTTSPAGLG